MVSCRKFLCNWFLFANSMAPKVTAKHIELPPFSNMRVCLASQVLSHSVAAGMSTLCHLGKMESNAMETAKFIERFDSLFDVFNSRTITDAKQYRGALHENSRHIEFLHDTKEWLKSVKCPGFAGTLPCLYGWRLSISALLGLWEDMSQSVGLQYLLTNRFNQNCLENFFSIIRGKGGHPDNPCPVEFRAAYRAAAVDSIFVVSNQSNYKDDVDNFLLNLSTITNHQESRNDNSNEASHEYMADLMRVANASCLTLPEENILVYIAGYLLRKLSKRHTCDICLQSLVQNCVSDPANKSYCFIDMKQYQHLDSGGLTYPSTTLVNFTNALEKVFRTSFPCVMHSSFVRSRLVKTTSSRVEDITCGNVKCQSAQSYMYLINVFMTVRIHHVLREQNSGFGVSGRKRNRKIVKFISHVKSDNAHNNHVSQTE